MENSFNTPPGNPPDNNLVWAILCTVLCCLPFGIVAIIKATKVRELWLQGDTVGAQKAADDAKKWSLWGAAISFGFLIIYFILIFAGIASGFMEV